MFSPEKIIGGLIAGMALFFLLTGNYMAALVGIAAGFMLWKLT